VILVKDTAQIWKLRNLLLTLLNAVEFFWSVDF